MNKFVYLRRVAKSRKEQALIYYTCLLYPKQPPGVRKKIDELCQSAGGEYAPALKEFLTTEASWQRICDKYYLSPSTLERIRREFYRMW